MASLYSALKRRRLAFSGTSGSGGLGIPPGSTLIRGAVIVTVMSWECSLSPSSVIDGVECLSSCWQEGQAQRAHQARGRLASYPWSPEQSPSSEWIAMLEQEFQASLVAVTA